MGYPFASLPLTPCPPLGPIMPHLVGVHHQRHPHRLTTGLKTAFLGMSHTAPFTTPPPAPHAIHTYLFVTFYHISLVLL